MRIFIQQHGFVNTNMLISSGHVIVGNNQEYDLQIWVDEIPGGNWNRTVMIFTEPPLNKDLALPYEHPDKFHTCFLFGSPRYSNSFDITEDPVAYPYYPCIQNDIWRENTAIRTRKIFFAGTRIGNPTGGDNNGRIDLYDTRNALVIGLQVAGIDVHAEGIGCARNSRKVLNWDLYKLWTARGSRSDYHLCCENSILRNYVTEKIHHGFSSDLVVLYLGCPGIEKYIPSSAFVNLNPYYNPQTRLVNVDDIARMIRYMSQKEYDTIIESARQWRYGDLLLERHLIQMNRVTRILLNRLK